MRTALTIGVTALAAVLLVGCFAGRNELIASPDEGGDVAGFWDGLWHGIIAPISFIVSLFSDAVRIYDVHNGGGWYDFGFVLGAGILTGGIGGTARRRSRD